MCCVYYVKHSLAEMTHLSKLALKAHSSNAELWLACFVTPWCDICPYIQRCWLTPKCPKRLLWVQQEWSHHPRTPFEPGHGSRKKPAATPPGIHWKLTAWTPCCSQGTSHLLFWASMRIWWGLWNWWSGTAPSLCCPLLHHQHYSIQSCVMERNWRSR